MSSPYKPKPTDTICGKRTSHGKCGGALYDVSSRLAMALGVVTLKCDRCSTSWGIKVSEGPTSVPVWDTVGGVKIP